MKHADPNNRRTVLPTAVHIPCLLLRQNLTEIPSQTEYVSAWKLHTFKFEL